MNVNINSSKAKLNLQSKISRIPNLNDKPLLKNLVSFASTISTFVILHSSHYVQLKPVSGLIMVIITALRTPLQRL